MNNRPGLENPSNEQKITELTELVSLLQAKLSTLEQQLQNPLNTPFLNFAKLGDEERLSNLLDCGADIEATDGEGLTALQLCVLNDHLKAAKFLASKGAKWDGINKEGETLLHMLCKRNMSEMLRLVLMDYPKNNLASLLDQLYELSDEAELQKIILNCLLFTGVKQNQLISVENALKKGVNIDVQDEHQETALHKAAYLNHPVIARLLLENNCDPDITDKHGQTASALAPTGEIKTLILHYKLLNAVRKQDSELVDQLLQLDINLNCCKDARGCTPLYYAVRNNDMHIAAKLLLKGANPLEKNNQYESCFHIAICDDNKYMINLLLRSENISNKQEMFALIDKLRSVSQELSDYAIYRFGKEKTLRMSHINSTVFAKSRIEQKIRKINKAAPVGYDSPYVPKK